MDATLRVINQMQSDGIIGRYAIGGAIGATFYLEPVSTLDIDIFVSFQTTNDSPLVSLAPIYAYLLQRGYQPENEHIMIESWLVQFLPADDALLGEALRDAVQIDFEGVQTWVMRAEHLMAIALKTGRTKDFLRIKTFIDAEQPNDAGSVNETTGGTKTLPSAASPGAELRVVPTTTMVAHKIFDEARLKEILQRHGLLPNWERFQNKFIIHSHD